MEYEEKFISSGVDKVQRNLELGLYASRRATAARAWLFDQPDYQGLVRNGERPVIIQQTIHQNILIVIAAKSKVMKWILSKMGKGHLLEHSE